MQAVRVVILVAAAATLVAGINVARRADTARALAARRYVCPMHAQVVSATPGDCPICGMPLARATDTGADIGRTVGVVQARITSREIVAPAWRDGSRFVSALLYDDEILMLEPRAAASFVPAVEAQPPSEPGRAAMAFHLSGDPPRRWDTEMSVVRFEAPLEQARSGRSGEREVGWIELAGATRRQLTVPRAAVRPSPAGPYLLVPAPDLKTLIRRPVQIGRTIAGHVTLVAGAREGERIIVADSFFVDTEARNASDAR